MAFPAPYDTDFSVNPTRGRTTNDWSPSYSPCREGVLTTSKGWRERCMQHTWALPFKGNCLWTHFLTAALTFTSTSSSAGDLAWTILNHTQIMWTGESVQLMGPGRATTFQIPNPKPKDLLQLIWPLVTIQVPSVIATWHKNGYVIGIHGNPDSSPTRGTDSM